MTDEPFYGYEASAGLHILKDEWAQKTHFGTQSQYLAKNLKEAIKATEDAVPERKGGFKLDRKTPQSIDESSRERIWEAAVKQRWSDPGLSAVKGCWDRVIAFQVPLYAAQTKSSWGYIDLLGVVGNTIPTVIELKKDPRARPTGGTDSSESPLRIVLEAAAYALALRVNWKYFKVEFSQRLGELGRPNKVPESLKTVHLVGAAPASYWMDWLPVTAKGRTVKSKTWEQFSSLLTALKGVGLPTSFVSISGDSDQHGKLAAQPLVHFPLIAECD